jgi:restriction system protein
LDGAPHTQLLTDYMPDEFEVPVTHLFRKMGYRAKTTKKSGDLGVDVIVSDDVLKIVVQVKQYSPGSRVGNREVQQLLGARPEKQQEGE